MIWVRRFFVIPFALLFFIILLGTLLVIRINGTVLNESFYINQLRKANLYHFVLNDVLTSGLDEIRAKDPKDLSGDLDVNPLETIDLTTEEIVAAVNRALPSEWVQAQVEQAIEEAGGYITGREDDFRFTIVAKDRVITLVDEVKALFIKANTYDLLFDEVIQPEADKALEDQGALPFNILLTSERLVTSAKAIVPKDWVENQVIAIIDEVTPYAVGDRDTFRIDIQLADLVEVALQEVKGLLREGDVYNLLYDEVIDPKVVEFIRGGFDLPYGVAVVESEILSALREVAPVDWVQQEVEGVIDSAGPYLVGASDTLSVTVSLEDNKTDATKVIERLANERLDALIAEFPSCDLGEIPGLESSGLPTCIPPGFDVSAILDEFDIDITGPVRELMDSRIPDSVTFTDTDLRQALIDARDEDNVELIDDVREILSDGWIYTDQDLRNDLQTKIGDDAIRVLDDVRDALRDGWTYTEADYRQDLIDADEAGTLEDIDEGRDVLSTVRTLQWAPFLIGLLLLVIIGFLGGRRWSSRFAWALAVLTISSLIIFVAAGPVWSSQGSDRIEDARTEALEDLDDTALLAADKLYTIALDAADEFFSGLQSMALIFFIVGAVLFVLAMLWPTDRVTRFRRRIGLTKAPPEPQPEQQTEEAPVPSQEESQQSPGTDPSPQDR